MSKCFIYVCFWKIFKGAKKEEYEDARKNLQKKKKGKTFHLPPSCSYCSRSLACQNTEIQKEPSLSCFHLLGCMFQYNLVPRDFSLRKWEGREKALASAGRFFFSDSLVAMLQLV